MVNTAGNRNPHISIQIETDQHESSRLKCERTKLSLSKQYASFNDTSTKSLSSPSCHQQKTFVYIRSDEFGWIPAELNQQICDKGYVIPRPSPRVQPLDDNNFSNRRALQQVQKYQRQKSFSYDDRFSKKNRGTVQELHFSESLKPLIENRDAEDTLITIDLRNYPNQTLPLQDVDENGNLYLREDMCDIPFHHEAAILYNLKGRFEGEDGVPYTRVGDIIISVNPYRWISGLYSEKNRHRYAKNLVWKPNYKEIKRLPPHLYEASAKAFKGLTLNNQNQSILVSGESGAGKTVSVKLLMAHLATFEDTKHKQMEASFVSTESPQNKIQTDIFGTIENIKTWITKRFYQTFSLYSIVEDVINETDEEELIMPSEVDEEPDEMQQRNEIVQRVLECNPLLEAFGNAKTQKNDNSSRFSKYIQLQFHVQYSGQASSSATLAGSKCVIHLLEKSRVMMHNRSRGERTFHIFYQLLLAPDEWKEKIWTGLVGSSHASFKYVGETETNIIQGLTDEERWRRTLTTLKTMGVEEDKIVTLMRGLCIVLQLGNLSFSPDVNNESASFISSRDELHKLSDILGIPSHQIETLFTSEEIAAGNEIIKKNLPARSAQASCNSLATQIYSLLFDWLVKTINDATRAEDNYKPDASAVTTFGTIGLLDIFGFETNEINSFEQLCVNYANEKLQKKFTQDVYCSVQEEYNEEGIDFAQVQFVDNSDVLNLIEGRLGLINLLKDQCLVRVGTEKAFVSNLYTNNRKSKSPLLINNRYSDIDFGIKHFAGNVTYNASQFLKKNRDSLPKKLEECILKCTNKLIKDELRERISINRGNKAALLGSNVLENFKAQLELLMRKISETKTWYVRCINPNKRKESGVMDIKYAHTQLKCAGLTSAISISRFEFSNKLHFEKVLDRFHLNRNSSQSYLTSFKFQSSSPRKNVICLLDILLKNMEYGSNDRSITKAYKCGKSLVYFRPGALEYLESERLKLFESSATIIQACYRRRIAIMKYPLIRKTYSDYVLPRKQYIAARVLSLVTRFFFAPSLSYFIWTRMRGIPLWRHRR